MYKIVQIMGFLQCILVSSLLGKSFPSVHLHYDAIVMRIGFDDFTFPLPCPHVLTNELLFSIANVMKSSGCEIPDWMLKLKKPSR